MSRHAYSPEAAPAPGWTRTTLRRGDALSFAEAGGALFAVVHQHGLSDVYRSTDEGLHWTRVSDALPPDLYVTCVLSAGGDVLVGTVCAGIYRTSDAGERWSRADAGLPEAATVYALAERDGTIFAGTAGAGVFRRTPRSARWEAASGGLPLEGHNLGIFALVAGSSGLYAQHHFGLHRTTDAGASWEAFDTGVPLGTALTLLAAQDGYVYAAGSERLYRASDAGACWSMLVNGFPERVPVRSFVAQGDVLFAGTQGASDSSVYCSTDGGASWLNLGQGLPRGTWSINLAATDRYLLAGVGEQGIWRLPRAAIRSARAGQTGVPLQLEQNEPNPASGETTIAFQLPRAERVVLTVDDLSGREVARLLESDLPPGRHEVSFDGTTLPAGFYYYRLSAGQTSLTRRMVILGKQSSAF